jgi:CubicO group peptidase (beta-lactamase class C family)
VTGAEADVDGVLAATYTDAVVIVHDGRLVFERYAGETAPDTPHLLMSITKSVVSCVTGHLAGRGLIDPAQQVTAHVPELAGSGYAGAAVRDLLDMRSGIAFSEDYDDPAAEVRVMEESMGWRPSSGGTSDSMYEYLTSLRAARPHGGVFDYRSCETDVLGWVCERAAGTRMADLISEVVWARLGAERDAEITCDRAGTAIHDGGMCATARDLARFGLMLLAGGQAAGGRVVPETWLRTAWAADQDIHAAFDGSVDSPYLPGGWYRNQFWFLPRPYGDVLLCLGIYGQMLYVAPATGTVGVKLSSWPTPQSAAMLHDTLRVFDAAGAVLAGLPAPLVGRGGLPGLVTGR